MPKIYPQTPIQDAAIQWTFEQEHAEWLAGIRADRPNGKPKEAYTVSATINSVYEDYKAKILRDAPKLQQIEAAYVAERERAKEWVITPELVARYTAIKTEAMKWSFAQEFADKISEMKQSYTNGKAAAEIDTLYQGYKNDLLASPEKLTAALEAYRTHPIPLVADRQNQGIITDNKRTIGV